MKTATSVFIAWALLLLYLYLFKSGVQVVQCVAVKGCTAHPVTELSAGMAQGLSVINGLITALVIAELAIAKPGDFPGQHLAAAEDKKWKKNVLHWTVGAYVLVWLVAGLWALIIGMQQPTALPAMTDIGQSWFGLAIPSAYAYFGLRQPTQQGGSGGTS